MYAPNAALSRNPAKTVVAVAGVLGSKTAELLATLRLLTHGTRVFRPAKQGYTPRQA